jgi:hypothetical protein
MIYIMPFEFQVTVSSPFYRGLAQRSVQLKQKLFSLVNCASLAIDSYFMVRFQFHHSTEVSWMFRATKTKIVILIVSQL